MFSFCPHCGKGIDQEQPDGGVIDCRYCGRRIGVVAPPKAAPADPAAASIRQDAARCPVCGQLVALKAVAGDRVLVPHFIATDVRVVCPGSGKPAAPARRPPGGKDLSAFMTREAVRVVSCRRGAEPRVEELTLEYLDRSDRVRLQIEALRDILGPDFRLRDYPAALGRPQLAVWGGVVACVVGKRHERGGYQPMTDAEVGQVVTDFRDRQVLFFP
jgi:DNA-directed RNA polymerase subunit RPC12/RpoP